MKSLSLGSRRGKFILAKLKPPLSSPLIYFPCFKYSNPREVLGKRCSGFLENPALKKMANMERLHPEPISPHPDVVSQHHWLIIRYEGSIGCLAIKADEGSDGD
jgi:hypothetical protein